MAKKIDFAEVNTQSLFNDFRTEGKNHDEAINTLLNCEPYCYHKEEIIELIRKSI